MRPVSQIVLLSVTYRLSESWESKVVHSKKRHSRSSCICWYVHGLNLFRFLLHYITQLSCLGGETKLPRLLACREIALPEQSETIVFPTTRQHFKLASRLPVGGGGELAQEFLSSRVGKTLRCTITPLLGQEGNTSCLVQICYMDILVPSYWDDKTKAFEMNGACSTHDVDEKCIQKVC
jgi:hypothetical protein